MKLTVGSSSPKQTTGSRGPSIGRIALGVLLLIGGFFVIEVFAEASHRVSVANKKYSVAYIITSGGIGDDRRLVSVLVNNEQGGNTSSKVVTPWKYENDNFLPGSFLYVNAQNQESQGSIKAEIYVDGSLVKSSTSEGEYGIATASAGLPQ